MTPGRPSDSTYWRKTQRLSAWLLLLWLAITLGVGLYGRALDFGLLGWPVGLWITSQGALAMFCAIVWYYAFAMDRLDREYGDDPAGD